MFNWLRGVCIKSTGCQLHTCACTVCTHHARKGAWPRVRPGWRDAPPMDARPCRLPRARSGASGVRACPDARQCRRRLFCWAGPMPMGERDMPGASLQRLYILRTVPERAHPCSQCHDGVGRTQRTGAATLRSLRPRVPTKLTWLRGAVLGAVHTVPTDLSTRCHAIPLGCKRDLLMAKRPFKPVHQSAVPTRVLATATRARGTRCCGGAAPNV